MEWKNVHLRFEDKLQNGDVCNCLLEDGCNWNQIGIVLAIYYDGQFYDAMVKEDNCLPHEQWLLCYDDGSTCVEEYLFTGKNVENINSPVLL